MIKESGIPYPGSPKDHDSKINEEQVRDERYAEVVVSQIETLLAHLGITIPMDAKILDIGTGNALLLKQLHKKGYDAIGIDSRPRGNSEESVGIARIERLPFKKESFDCLISIGVFDSTLYKNQDQAAMVEEIVRVLKPQGVFVSMMDNIDSRKIESFLKPLTDERYQSYHVYQKA